MVCEGEDKWTREGSKAMNYRRELRILKWVTTIIGVMYVAHVVYKIYVARHSGIEF